MKKASVKRENEYHHDLTSVINNEKNNLNQIKEHTRNIEANQSTEI